MATAPVSFPPCHPTRPSTRRSRRWAAGHPWIYRSDVERRPDVPAGAVRVRDPRGARARLGPRGARRSEISPAPARSPIPSARIDDAWWHGALATAIARRAPLRDLRHRLPSRFMAKVTASHRSSATATTGGSSSSSPAAGLEAFRDPHALALLELTGADGILARNDVPLRSRRRRSRAKPFSFTATCRARSPSASTAFDTSPPVDRAEDGRLPRPARKPPARRRGRARPCSRLLQLSRLLRSAPGAGRGAGDGAGCVGGGARTRGAERDAERPHEIDFVEANAFDSCANRSAPVRGTRRSCSTRRPSRRPRRARRRPARVQGDQPARAPAARARRAAVQRELQLSPHEAALPGDVESAAADSGRRVALRTITGQPLDHPELLTVPETGYLKGALLEAME